MGADSPLLFSLDTAGPHSSISAKAMQSERMLHLQIAGSETRVVESSYNLCLEFKRGTSEFKRVYIRSFGDGPCVPAGEMPRAHGMAHALMTPAPAPATPGASRLKAKKAACRP